MPVSDIIMLVAIASFIITVAAWILLLSFKE